jgi:hypothetical protein
MVQSIVPRMSATLSKSHHEGINTIQVVQINLQTLL